MATHVRVGSPLLTHVLFPIYVAVFVWGGLVLRRPSLIAVLLGAPEPPPDPHAAVVGHETGGHAARRSGAPV